MRDSFILTWGELVENTRWQLDTTIEGTDKSKRIYWDSHPRLSEYSVIVLGMTLEGSCIDGGNNSACSS
jgi:hypothetical protein